jgi:hypothetical protein
MRQYGLAQDMVDRLSYTWGLDSGMEIRAMRISKEV